MLATEDIPLFPQYITLPLIASCYFTPLTDWILQPVPNGRRLYIINNNFYTENGILLELTTTLKIDVGQQIECIMTTDSNESLNEIIDKGNFKLFFMDIFSELNPQLDFNARMKLLSEITGNNPIVFPINSFDYIAQKQYQIKSFGFKGMVLKKISSPLIVNKAQYIMNMNWIYIDKETRLYKSR